MFVVSFSRKSPCQALFFLRIMLRDGMQPTQVVHGVVIGACIKSRQLKEGWHHPWKVAVKFLLCKAIHDKPWRYTFGKWVILTMNMCWFHEDFDPLKFMKNWGIKNSEKLWFTQQTWQLHQQNIVITRRWLQVVLQPQPSMVTVIHQHKPNSQSSYKPT